MRLRLLAAVLLTGPLFAADPELLSLAMPDTQVVAGINVEQVSLAPLGQFVLALSRQQSDAGLQKLIESTGFDPRRDLREILVASNGQPGSHVGIFLARGTFNIPRIVEAALADGATLETYKGVQIIQVKSNKDQGMAFPDATLAIGGDLANVHGAIDRRSAPTAVNSTLAVAVHMASSTEDAWFVSMVPPSQLQPRGPDAKPAEGPFAILQKVQQASGGVKFGANVVLTLRAVSQTPQDASALADVLRSLAGMAQMAAGKEANVTAMVGLLRSLDVSAEGSTTKLSLSIPEQQIEELIKSAPGTPAGGAVGWDPRAPGR